MKRKTPFLMNLGYDDYIRFEPNSKKENDEPDDIEYEAVKKEWAILCEQINVINEEREVLELKKNKLLQKLCKLGENNMPKGENIFNINSKSKLDYR